MLILPCRMPSRVRHSSKPGHCAGLARVKRLEPTQSPFACRSCARANSAVYSAAFVDSAGVAVMPVQSRAEPTTVGALEPAYADASVPTPAPSELSARTADGRPGDADAGNARATRTACKGDLRDYAVLLRDRRGRHCFSRSHNHKSKSSDTNHFDHCFSLFVAP
jgi:hypothetical protein